MSLGVVCAEVGIPKAGRCRTCPAVVDTEIYREFPEEEHHWHPDSQDPRAEDR